MLRFHFALFQAPRVRPGFLHFPHSLVLEATPQERLMKTEVKLTPQERLMKTEVKFTCDPRRYVIRSWRALGHDAAVRINVGVEAIKM